MRGRIGVRPRANDVAAAAADPLPRHAAVLANSRPSPPLSRHPAKHSRPSAPPGRSRHRDQQRLCSKARRVLRRRRLFGRPKGDRGGEALGCHERSHLRIRRSCVRLRRQWRLPQARALARAARGCRRCPRRPLARVRTACAGADRVARGLPAACTPRRVGARGGVGAAARRVDRPGRHRCRCRRVPRLAAKAPAGDVGDACGATRRSCTAR